MTQQIQIANSNNGDGSASTHFFKGVTDKMWDELEDADPEGWGMSEGFTTLTFPDDFDFQACGIRFTDYDEKLELAKDFY